MLIWLITKIKKFKKYILKTKLYQLNKYRKTIYRAKRIFFTSDYIGIPIF